MASQQGGCAKPRRRDQSRRGTVGAKQRRCHKPRNRDSRLNFDVFESNQEIEGGHVVGRAWLVHRVKVAQQRMQRPCDTRNGRRFGDIDPRAANQDFVQRTGVAAAVSRCDMLCKCLLLALHAVCARVVCCCAVCRVARQGQEDLCFGYKYKQEHLLHHGGPGRRAYPSPSACALFPQVAGGSALSERDRAHRAPLGRLSAMQDRAHGNADDVKGSQLHRVLCAIGVLRT